MKKLSLTATAVFALFMVACNNQPKTEEKPVETAPAAAPAAEAKPVFTPYKGVMVVQTVQDFDKWNAGFAKDEPARKAAGLTDPGIGRDLDNDKKVIVLLTAADLAKAKEMTNSPALKESMKKAGVTAPPTITFLDVIFDDTTTIAQHDRLMVTHHVKDFDTWKKAFDAEGPAKRAEHGFVDRALARNTDDPNTVTILFAVNDVAKAKAAVATPEMKKMMTDAGVDGPPTLTWFKWVNQ